MDRIDIDAIETIIAFENRRGLIRVRLHLEQIGRNQRSWGVWSLRIIYSPLFSGTGFIEFYLIFTFAEGFGERVWETRQGIIFGLPPHGMNVGRIAAGSF